MKIFYTVATSKSRIAAFVLLAFVGSMFVGTSALAAPPSPSNPATIYVPNSRYVQSTISKISATPEGAASLKSGAIKVEAHNRGLLKGGYLDYEGETIAKGEAAIQAQLARWKAENEALNNKKPESNIECIPVRPGQVNETMTPEAKPGVEFKPGSVSGYGPMTDEPLKFPIAGNIQDEVGTIKESPLNFKLRSSGSAKLQEQINAALAIDPKAPPEKAPVKRVVILPDAAQAAQFVATKGKNYLINGIPVEAGKKYTVGKTDTDGITFDKDCNPKKGPIPSPSPNGENPLGDFGEGDGGGDGGGGGGGDDGGGGLGGGGLAALLPLLMSLMGQQGNQNQQAQQQQAQNPLYNAQGQCSQQGVSPVCGVDGKTYTNECYLQQKGITLAKKGVCDAPAASPTPAVTPNVAAITTQLSESGIPASLLATIQASIISALTAAFGGNVGETVIR